MTDCCNLDGPASVPGDGKAVTVGESGTRSSWPTLLPAEGVGRCWTLMAAGTADEDVSTAACCPAATTYNALSKI